MEMMRAIVRRLIGLFSSGPAVQDSAPAKSLDVSKTMDGPMEKVDAKFIEAVRLFDELDKMVNKYAMVVRNLYDDHFPELASVVPDNVMYAKVVKLMGNRTNAATLDFSKILSEEVETQLKEAAAVSIGCGLNELDLININGLCDQVLSLSESRDQLYEDLKTKMNTIAPNLTALAGDLVGARLIAHAGGTLNLAKQPGSTIQLYGAEKAFRRALRTKHATPKYGHIIYNSPLISKASPRNKKKMARSLAAKIALAIRYDVLGDAHDNTMGLETLNKLEARLRSLEGRAGKAMPRPIEPYNQSADAVTPMLCESKIKKKRTKRSRLQRKNEPENVPDQVNGGTEDVVMEDNVVEDREDAVEKAYEINSVINPKRISSVNPKQERYEVERDRNRRPGDRDRNDDESNHHVRDDARDKAHDREREGEHGLNKLKTPENKKVLDVKQLIAMIPETKVELFAYDINWEVYGKYELHERMRPWISKKITEFLGGEEPTLVDYIVSSTKDHIRASQMLELLQPILDDEAEMFVLKMWRMLIFEIKKVEMCLSLCF